MSWLMRFTDAELEAIYTAIERVPADTRYEDLWESVVEKVCAEKVGNPRPVGAIDLESDVERLRASLLTVTEQVESCCSRSGLCIDADRVRAEAKR